ncbi:CRISPR-associated endoribonuclease Cas6 [Cytophagaceae bacterium ABcell3]|nr:CRISPR-associated endoribonuclease Cas6 [Cytophagaceae bacterium ABcell3]
MRVRIIFGLTNKGATVPFHHQFLLANLIQSLVDRTGGKYQNFNMFNFSGLKGQTKVGKEGLHFYSNKVTLVLSSPEEEFIRSFVDVLFKQPQVEIGKLLLVPLNVETEAAPDLSSGEVKYICISPLVIINPLPEGADAKKFISPLMDVFSDMLYESTMFRMEKSGMFTTEEIASFYKFQVLPDKNYLSKIKEEEKKFARIFPVFHNREKYEVRGYTFPFTLYADPKVQQFVWDCGLGIFTYKGFGMVDLANADPNQRTIPYEF